MITLCQCLKLPLDGGFSRISLKIGTLLKSDYLKKSLYKQLFTNLVRTIVKTHKICAVETNLILNKIRSDKFTKSKLFNSCHLPSNIITC